MREGIRCDELAGEQHRDARGVRRDRLGAQAADGRSSWHRPARTKMRLSWGEAPRRAVLGSPTIHKPVPRPSSRMIRGRELRHRRRPSGRPERRLSLPRAPPFARTEGTQQASDVGALRPSREGKCEGMRARQLSIDAERDELLIESKAAERLAIRVALANPVAILAALRRLCRRQQCQPQRINCMRPWAWGGLDEPRTCGEERAPW